MKNKKKENNKNIFRDAKLLIDQNIYKFLLALLKNIFIQKNKTTKAIRASIILNGCIEKVNQNIIGKDNKKSHLDSIYTYDNFKNIFDFVKTQNILFYSEILENLLIIVFGMAYKAVKENIFGKYIYNDIKELKDSNNYIFDEWFNQQKFNSKVLKKEMDAKKSYIMALLENDLRNKSNNESNEFQKKEILIQFLKDIFDGKLAAKEKKDNLNDETQFSPNETMSKYTSMLNNLLYTKDIGIIDKKPILLSRSLLISVYIYGQIKNSPLMKYIKESDNNKELEALPFIYDLSESAIESENSNIIFAPVRIEPRIEEIKMYKIFMREKSCLEFSKALLFNQNIIL